ncbi:MAG: DUF1905 domain-containing protein [Bacteroidia bacterium]|nr:DUF1905 domain-containing protein [Bacteroidia bacterium]
MKQYKFEALIIKHKQLDSGFIEFPYDTEKEFGKKGQVKVKAWFDGFLYRGSLVKMGHHCHLIGLNKEVRKAINKNPGDIINVVIEEDKDKRTVDIPNDLILLLKEFPLAEEKFNKMSYSHKKEWVMWLNDAKKEETRLKRLQKIIDKLME